MIVFPATLAIMIIFSVPCMISSYCYAQDSEVTIDYGTPLPYDPALTGDEGANGLISSGEALFVRVIIFIILFTCIPILWRYWKRRKQSKRTESHFEEYLRKNDMTLEDFADRYIIGEKERGDFIYTIDTIKKNQQLLDEYLDGYAADKKASTNKHKKHKK